MADATGAQLDTVMQEGRLFEPSEEFRSRAAIKSLAEYEAIWNEAAADIEGFWAKQAEELHWFEPYDKVLEWNEPFAKWFVGGKTNVSYNCLDANIEKGLGEKTAITRISRLEPPQSSRLTCLV